MIEKYDNCPVCDQPLSQSGYDMQTCGTHFVNGTIRNHRVIYPALPAEPYRGLNKTLGEWAKVNPRAVASGSAAQAENVLKMALEDIRELHRLWQADVVMFMAAKALRNYLQKSLNAGPMTKNPTKETVLLRNLWAALDQYEKDNLVHG